LIFSLSRNGQIRELVFDAFSHFIPFPTGKNISRNNLYITLDRFRPKLFDCQTFWLKSVNTEAKGPENCAKQFGSVNGFFGKLKHQINNNNTKISRQTPETKSPDVAYPS